MSLLKRQGFTEEMSKLITAQAGFETGNFTSVIFKENNNLFGMKLPKVRKTTAIGENRGHAGMNRAVNFSKVVGFSARIAAFDDLKAAVPLLSDAT